MVYERLPIKTTHHGDEELTLVYRTLPGISIFTTCHEIYDEAKAILSPRLATIRNQPLQLVASPHDHRRLDSFLECLAASEVNCISLKAIRELIAWTYCDDCHDHYTEHDNLDLPVNTPAQQVCLARPPYLLELRVRYSNTNNDQLPPAIPPDKMPPDKRPDGVAGSARGIQSDEPFPFLDLPKDVRLMVYENLPTKLTHYKNDRFTLVYRTIAGINILATCSFVKDEASAILMPRLTAIKSKPVQLIISPWPLDDDIETLLRCLAASEVNCPLSKDLRKLMGSPELQFQRRESFLGYPSQHEYPAMPNLSRWCICSGPDKGHIVIIPVGTPLGDQIASKLDRIQSMVGGICDSKPARDLSVKVRRVLITSEAKEEQAKIDVSRADPVLVNRYGGITSPLLSEGAPIEEAEWDQDWAEGER
ncbi:hypothetical protein SNOG_02419 [Parastagonospora nodorum SN15]|uniref:Uncharacterized protein n=1 Tax=Phaeosphaeria nodorum (strain SN15 / ATCC MYA-4574 / FGSC 10173) TaxID=321614 RepID=Q0V0P5_PHANO|nr:hypothetical protein SNOG_02419 [Parastagonospora nodorum SN15]EAT90631.2 hypothetical protein SNOG_02419 [Parastagonospora nodorum SN15]